MENFNILPRADGSVIHNLHCIYRVYKIDGLRKSNEYDGTGIEKTYDLTDTDSQYPPDEDAVPDLVKIGSGVGSRKVMRKDFQYTTAVCPECDKAGVVEPDKKEKFCPECGMILGRGDAIDSDTQRLGPALSRDPQDAERPL